MLGIKKIITEIIIRFAPSRNLLKKKLLYNKYLKVVRFKGENILLERDTEIIRSKGLVLGKNIIIRGRGIIDATAGIMIGNNCSINKRVDIKTVGSTSPKVYDPVVIGAGNKVDRNITPGEIWPNKIECKGLSNYPGQIVFVLSTGRSGSKAIAQLLNQHSAAECYHDSFPHLNTWSCDFLYGRAREEAIAKKIHALYNAANIGRTLVHGQSDQKLAPLVPILAKLFPTAKFIWLIRTADSFLSSSYPRGWFDNSEFGYAPNKEEFFTKEVTPSPFDAAHRTNGFLANEIEEDKWRQMTAFERNCWYWTYWNNLIERELSKLTEDRSMTIRLNELESNKKAMLDFLGLDGTEIKTEKINKANYKKVLRKDWTDEMEAIYKQHCEAGMKKWFS